MSVTELIELQAIGVRFFSPNDEAAFFEWLKKLSCVEKFEGQGRTLYISVNKIAVDENALRELLALFRRYEIDMRQLAIFDKGEFAEWFRNKEAYWYKNIFEPA